MDAREIFMKDLLSQGFEVEEAARLWREQPDYEGTQFRESFDPQEALAEIRRNPDHPYFTGTGKEHDEAVEHVNSLLAQIQKRNQ